MRYPAVAVLVAWVGVVAFTAPSFVAGVERADDKGTGKADKEAGPATGPVIGWASVDGGTTGGAGGPTVDVADADALAKALRGDEPAVARIAGTITLAADVRVGSNKTVLGQGAGGTITGAGLNVRQAENVVIRNLTLTNVKGDAINVEGSRHVWVDHCDLSRAGDGLLDVKHGSDLVTVSWNHFHDHHKTCLLGHSDKPEQIERDRGKLRVTYHHNFFDGTQTRHPRVRVAEPVHVFNNYFRGNEYGVASLADAGVIVEGNYFERVESPTHTLYGETKEPGRLVERDNVYVDSGRPETRGTVREVKAFYAYTPDPARDVPKIVGDGAGVGKLDR